ncbi:MAG: sugar ABC transporter permease [Inquilinus sp.]|nr:sugar ABC transporter permease [Inquilinus sp.]
MTTTTSTESPPASGRSRLWRLLAALEVDTRLLGMVTALAVIWIGFDVLTGGTFLTARNLWNLAVQTSVVGVMATGMVLVIVTRNIDLSVGSVLGFLGMIMAFVQVEILPDFLPLGHPMIWVSSLVLGLVLGAAIGAFQGFWIAHAQVPAFIVTLGGLLVFRGGAWWITFGRTVAPLDQTFQRIGGGIAGSIGDFWSWVAGAIAIAVVLFGAYRSRAKRREYNFPLKPVWAELVINGSAVAAIVAFVMVMNAYDLPPRTVADGIVTELIGEVGAGGLSAESQALVATFPPAARELVAGLPNSESALVRALSRWDDLPTTARGIPVPVLILIGVAVVMTFVARRTRFGRYVFAIGGNPEAAELAGVNTRRVIMTIFIVMGLLCAIAGAILSARLNAGANSTGLLAELSVIAAAVIGGTSLAGGVGTIVGALLGALVMQSLQSGMILLGMDTPLQNIVIGLVLIIAVWIDTVYQKHRR